MGTKLEKQVFYSIKIGNEILDITGRKRTKKGYVALCIKNHPFSDKTNGYIFEHRIIVEMNLGRFLNHDEIVHHLNDIKHDNRLDNLMVMTNAEHTIFHNKNHSQSDEAKKLISLKAKSRLKNKRNHPLYKNCDDELKKLFREGKKVGEIAEILDITRQTVTKKIKYLGLREDVIND